MAHSSTMKTVADAIPVCLLFLFSFLDSAEQLQRRWQRWPTERGRPCSSSSSSWRPTSARAHPVSRWPVLQNVENVENSEKVPKYLAVHAGETEPPISRSLIGLDGGRDVILAANERCRMRGRTRHTAARDWRRCDADFSLSNWSEIGRDVIFGRAALPNSARPPPTRPCPSSTRSLAGRRQ